MTQKLIRRWLAGGLLLLAAAPLPAQEQDNITVTRKGDSIYFDIPDRLLDRQWLVVNRLVTANAGSSQFADDQMGGEQVISFHKAGTLMTARLHGYEPYLSQAGSPMTRVVERSNQPLPLDSFRCLPAGAKKNRIEVSSFLAKKEAIFFSKADAIDTVQVYTKYIGVTAHRLSKGPDKMPVTVYSALFLLPEKPMRPRPLDERVGYFRTDYLDLSSPAQPGRRTELACRWRMEPAPKDLASYRKGQLVEPAEPIIFYIDPATPKAWVPYLIQGINDWQAAFEQAGFRNAIIGREAPTDDPDWQLEACRAAIIYKPSATENAFGPNVHDPRSGEIIQTHVNWHHNILGWLQAMYMVQAAAVDTAARSKAFDEALMGKLIRCIATHEVGHALGLAHNLGASATVPVENLRNNQWLQEHGHCPSIMDYARYNYVAQPEDGVKPENLLPRIGDYDKWAIEWAYRWWPSFRSDQEEKEFLNQWVRSKVSDPRLRWGNGESITGGADPSTQPEDLGDDPLLASTYGIANLQRILPRLEGWLDNSNGDDAQLSRVYREILAYTPNGASAGQFSHYISKVAALIGGVYTTPRVVEDTEPVKRFPSAQQQRAALGFLDRQLFTTPQWLLEPSLLKRSDTNPLILVGTLQHATLVQIFSRIGSLQTAEALYGTQAFRSTELLDSLRLQIWRELYTHAPIDIYRRSLQNIFINALSRVMNTPDLTDTYAFAQATLKQISKAAADYADQCSDEATKSHLLAVQRRIYKALNNK